MPAEIRTWENAYSLQKPGVLAEFLPAGVTTVEPLC